MHSQVVPSVSSRSVCSVLQDRGCVTHPIVMQKMLPSCLSDKFSHSPKHLIGLLFATVKCYGEIEATND